MDLTLDQIIYFILAAMIVGFTKTSIGGLTILAVALMATAFPGKVSAGIILPMLIIADIVAVIYFHRSCQWAVIGKILPITMLGIILGYSILGWMNEAYYEPLLGLIILSMLGFSIYMDSSSVAPSSKKIFVVVSGLSAGIATMLANVAGPIFAIYLLQMGLEKKQFVGTRSWFFLIINVLKVPFSADLGLISAESLKLNAMSIPFIVLGAFLGYLFLKRIHLNIFKGLIRVVIVFAAIKLIVF